MGNSNSGKKYLLKKKVICSFILVFGRDLEIRRCIEILLEGTKNNVILTGPLVRISLNYFVCVT